MEERELSAGWNRVFRLEIPLTASTIVYWLVAPGDYLRSVFGVPQPDAGHLGLLRQLAIVVGSIFVIFYTRTLFSPRVLLRPFAHLQEALLASDVLLAATAFLSSAGGPRSIQIWASIGMALLWAGLRVRFLFDIRRT